MVDTVSELKVVNSYRSLPSEFYTELKPQPLNDPRLLHVNRALAHEMGLSDKFLNDPTLLEVCAGNQPLPNGDTLADWCHCEVLPLV